MYTHMYRYLMSFILLWKLMKQVDLLPPSRKGLQLVDFSKMVIELYCIQLSVVLYCLHNWYMFSNRTGCNVYVPVLCNISTTHVAGFYLLTRVIAVTFCVTLAASMAARLGPTPMAAFQIFLQVWLTSSLLVDGLAVAGQVVINSTPEGQMLVLLIHLI